MSTSLHRVCGLTLKSDIDLPELPPGEGAPDVVIRRAAVPEPADLPPIGPLTRADRNHLWLHVPGVARFWVREGREILVEPEPGCDEGGLRSLLLASPLAALLFQRDRLVMHGNAVAIDGQALLILGSSGSGKSTVAAQFMQRGHRLLADDVVALDDEGRALPGIPRLKLWRNALKVLDIPLDGLTPVRPGVERYQLPFGDRYAITPLPVRWMVLLTLAPHQDVIEMEELRGMDRFMPLRKHTYRVSFMDHMGIKARHLTQIAALSARIELSVLTNNSHDQIVANLVDPILEAIARGGI